MYAYSVSVSLSLSHTHMHTYQNSFMFYSLLLHEVHAVPKQKDPDVILLLFFCCLQYVAQTYGKEADTWFGSDLDPVIFAQFLLVFI